LSQNQIAVFLGPSCPLNEAKGHLASADYFPPAARGSFYDIVNDGYRVIVLIDGLFYGKLSVWHKEILYALDSGIEVIGASSMGALRAAELDGTGITGVGTIYGWYRDGVIDGDDEVALLHEGSEDGFSSLTIPLVNLRWCLMRAVAEGAIDQQSEALIIERSRQMCFTDRSIDVILQPLEGVVDIVAVKKAFASAEDLKKADAILALKLAAERAPFTAPLKVSALREYEYSHVNLGIEYYLNERLTSIKAKSKHGIRPLADYLGRISTDHAGYRDLIRARVCQRLIVGWATELHVDYLGEGESDCEATSWDAEVLDLSHRRATGLTLIDIARERRDAALSRRLQERTCHNATGDVIAAIDGQLAAQAQESPIPWQRMVQLTGRLVYTMCCIGLQKHIRPQSTEDFYPAAPWQDDFIQSDAGRVLAYAEWIYQTNPRVFGYMLDPAREVLLAYQFLNCLDSLESKAAA